MKVIHFQRAKGVGVSIERLFKHIRSAFPEDVDVEVKYLPYGGTHPLNLVRNCWFAFCNQGDMNHVTGDCHYIVLVMNPRKTILTVHDCVNLHKLSGFRRWVFKKMWYDWPCRWVKKITAISNFSKCELLEHVSISSNKVEVIYNCVDPFFKPGLIKVQSNKPVLLQIGTKSNKNLDRIAVALKGLNCHLRIVGALSHVQKAQLEKNDLDYSNVYGLSDEELRDEFTNSTLLLFASTYEGFGLPIVEAQAIGLPVVTSNIEPMKEVAGDGALFVDPLDVTSIRSKVVLALKSDLQEVIVRGLYNVDRFRTNRIAGQYHEVYGQVINAD